MAIPTHNFVFQQGEDGEISLVYKQDGLGVDLTGYKLRMDVRNSVGVVLFTFNSEDIVGDGARDVSGTADNEAVLGSNGSIYIVVPRSASLGDGPLANAIGEALQFDIFLRGTNDKQRKILKGTITIEASQTKWT